MKRLIAAALLTIAAGVGGVAQTQDIRSAFTVSLKYDRTDFALGEPVVGFVVVRNKSTAPQPIRERLEPEYGACRFDIKPPDAPEAKPFHPWIAAENDRLVTLAPDEERAALVKLFYGSNGWTFSRPGRYDIVASCFGAQSDVAAISVHTSETDGDRQAAAALLEEPQAGLFLLLDGGDHLARGKAVLERIASTQAASVIAGYANVGLGLNAAQPSMDFGTGALRPPDHARAEKYLVAGNEELKKVQYGVYAIKALNALAETKRALGRMSEFNQVQAALTTETNKIPSTAIKAAIRESAIRQQ